MLRKAKRYFNTSGHNIPAKHYTLKRENLIPKGLQLVTDDRYFTIWAPRQTGKTTYFISLAQKLESMGFEVLHINLENFKSVTEKDFLEFLAGEFEDHLDIQINSRIFALFYKELKRIKDRKIVLIIDEETFELLHMHEEETGQRFDRKVKEKITAITANQPGLVNGFAYQLVSRYPREEVINYDHYLEIEDWYLTEAIDKNISNIINKAKQHRKFVEKLLFTGEKQKFMINDETIKFLHSHGLIKKDEDGYVEFWVPMYKKALYDAFYPIFNGESSRFFRNIDFKTLFYKSGRLNFDILIDNYKDYVKRRSFKYFREKDENTGKYKSIKEAALAYSFETYIQTLVQTLEGKSYLEPHTSLGRCDLVINIENCEYVVEFKIFRDMVRFEKGKKQLAFYCGSVGIAEGIYLVFVPNTVTLPSIKEGVENIDNIEIKTYIVLYDEEKDF